MWTLATTPLDGDALVLDSCWASDLEEFIIVGSKLSFGFDSVGKSIATSSDGINWTYRDSPVDSPPALNYGSDIRAVIRCESLGLYVAVGRILKSESFFSGDFVTAAVMISTDGITWSIPGAPAYNTRATNPWIDPAVSNNGGFGTCIACKDSTGLLIAGGQQQPNTHSHNNVSALQYSTDGTNWASLPSPFDNDNTGSNRVYSIAYSPETDTWVAIGFVNPISGFSAYWTARSTDDGVTWSSLSDVIVIEDYLLKPRIRWDKYTNLWFLLGTAPDGPSFAVSSTGLGWTGIGGLVPSTSYGAYDILDINGSLFAASGFSFDTTQMLASTTDYVTWGIDETPNPFPYPQRGDTLAYSPILNRAIVTSGRNRCVAYGLPTTASHLYKRLIGFFKNGQWNLVAELSGDAVSYYKDGIWNNIKPFTDELVVYHNGQWTRALEPEA